jgi:hypothetical protein
LRRVLRHGRFRAFCSSVRYAVITASTKRGSAVTLCQRWPQCRAAR